MRFIIVGAGAVGSVVGSHLTKAGAQVVLVGDPPHIEKIRRHGLSLTGKYGEFVTYPSTCASFGEWQYQPDDVIFLAVKTYDTPVALEQLGTKVPADTPVFCLQNTVSNEPLAAQHFTRVYGVALHLGARFIFPGEVSHLGGNTLVIGRYPRGQDALADTVVTALNSAKLHGVSTDDVMAYKWAKLCINLLNSPLAILGLSGEEAWNDSEVRPLLAAILDEAKQVLGKSEIPLKTLPGDQPLTEMIAAFRRADFTPRPLSERALQVYPSMWQDLYCRRGRTEARYLNGKIVELGQQMAIPTPVNALLVQVADRMAERRELPGTYTVADLNRRLGTEG
ncbi:MAG TPA: ketopantoate reductase family protein [Candidatus Binatia bacterium]|jgi:2-dehydropantoate 2-reductase|nr:ketopantoate reductase family protein [Candidatus Binatia bacterium]